jgi:hypothetical protein
MKEFLTTLLISAAIAAILLCVWTGVANTLETPYGERKYKVSCFTPSGWRTFKTSNSSPFGASLAIWFVEDKEGNSLKSSMCQMEEKKHD